VALADDAELMSNTQLTDVLEGQPPLRGLVLHCCPARRRPRLRASVRLPASGRPALADGSQLGQDGCHRIVSQRNKAADGEHLLGRHIDRERTPVQVVATSPAPAAESEATVADITSNPIFSATSSPHPDRVMSRLSTSQRAVAISSRIIALDLTQGGSAVGQVVLGYRNLGHRGLAQPKNSIHL